MRLFKAGAVLIGFMSHLILDEIWAVVRPDNTPSLAVCARAGMTPRGRTTRYYGTELELFHVPRPDRG